MSDASRKYVLTRRANPVADLKAITYMTGEQTVEEAIASGILTENCVYQVGIATAVESRLDVTRYPIEVVIGVRSSVAEAVVTSCGYWRVVNSAGQQILFSRRPPVNETVIANIRRILTDLDSAWWDLRKTHPTADVTIQAEHHASVVTIWQNLSLLSPTDEQKSQAINAFQVYMEHCRTTNACPYLKVSESLFIQGIPVGKPPADQNPMSAAQLATCEVALCAKVNARQMAARYPNVPSGAIALAAWSVAMMFRTGLMETHEHKEFICLTVNPSGTQDFMVNSVLGPAAYVVPQNISAGQTITIKDMKFSARTIELANMLVMGSGLMHYLFNHTTGGTKLNGVLLSLLAMQGIINQNTPPAELEDITSLFYEALHPVNKRAVADLMFQSSKVYTHGKSTHARRYGMFSLDTFAQIRKNPFPAGSHKAFTCLSALKRVLMMGIGPFLPWASEIPAAIAMCSDILTSGASAHIGAHYYTGKAGVTQSSGIDNYLPEVAMFIQTFHSRDSLAMSPHLGIETASRAAASWTNLLKTLKGEDLSAAPVEKVQEFLATSGQSVFAINLDDQSTWAKALDTTSDGLKLIDSVFKSV